MIQGGFRLLLCIAVVTANPPPAPPAPVYPTPVPGPPAPPVPTPGPPAPANLPCVNTCKTVPDLNLAKLAKTWYVVRSTGSSPGREGTCETATFEAKDDKSLDVDNRWVDTSGKPQKLLGTMTFSDGQVTIKSKDTTITYIYFYVNYDTMFGAYTCIEKKAYVFVFSTKQEVPDGELTDLNAAMTANGLQPTWLKPTPRTGCPTSY